MSGVAERVKRGVSGVDHRGRIGVAQDGARRWTGFPSACGKARRGVLWRHGLRRDRWRNGASPAPLGRVG
jgi:hypothetical protein